MNDESKKLELFEKEFTLVEHTYAPGSKDVARAGWIGGFYEILGIIDHEYARGRRGVTAMENVRLAICDELGMTDDAQKAAEPRKCEHIRQVPGMIIGDTPEDCDRKAAVVVRESFRDYCDCLYDFNCKSLRGRYGCVGFDEKQSLLDRLGNLLNKCGHSVARSVITTYADKPSTIKCGDCGYTAEYGGDKQ